MLGSLLLSCLFAQAPAATTTSSQDVARVAVTPADAAEQIDAIIAATLADEGIDPAPIADDDTLLRRLSLDLAGTLPDAADAARFGLDDSPQRVGRVVASLLDDPGYGEKWARYWAATIFSRQTNTRPTLEQRRGLTNWLATELNAGTTWDAIASDLLTATGETVAEPRTAFIFAHAGEVEEFTGEVSRVFMGIQMSCAQCHDHPFDRWTRDEFHELAAFFPRVQIRPSRDGVRLSFTVQSLVRGRERPTPDQLFAFADRNRDDLLDEQELMTGRLRQVGGYLLRRADANNDKKISREEVANAPNPMQTGQGAMEHRMSNLIDPTEEGEIKQPRLFTTGAGLPPNASDLERRFAAAAFITSTENVWFARSVVNRYWAELMGEGFYVPVDDLGPDRQPALPEVVDLLSEGFVASGYDLRWLLATITQTEAYRREGRADAVETGLAGAEGQVPTRLRGDQVFDALASALAINEDELARRRQSPRAPTEREYVGELFGGDPSVATRDEAATISQALFLMNTEAIESLIDGDRRTVVGEVLQRHRSNADALEELYFRTLGRAPDAEEQQQMLRYIRRARSRTEGFEDVTWSLLNSAEFLSRK